MKQDPIDLRLVPLDDLVHWDRNPKGHDIDLLVRSLKTYGYVRPIMVNDNIGKMLFGHGLHEALTKMRDEGDDPPRRVEVDESGAWMVRVLFCDLEEPLHEPYVVIDNRSTELGGWDDGLLVSALSDAGDLGLLEATGFSNEDLEAMLMDFSAVPEGDQSELGTTKVKKCPHCGKTIDE